MLTRSSHGRRRMPLRAQAILFQVAVLALVLLLATLVSTLVLRRDLEQQFEQRALGIARTVAQREGLAGQVSGTRPSPDGPVQRYAEQVRRATGSLYVVVTDDAGIRFSHPTVGLIGQRVSTDPSEALAGREVVAIQRGTLGDSARGKVPLRAADGRVVGEVSVGIDIADLNHRMWQLALLLALVAAAALAVGAVGAVALARRLRQATLGLEPEDMADLLREHEAVLGGVRDGVIAVDDRGRVSVCNAEASRIVGASINLGAPLAGSGAPAEVVALFDAAEAPVGAMRVVGERVVLATRLPVRREGRDLGRVLILRDRSDLDELGRELEATRALTDALRAQAHEYTNRLHALSGLLHLGHVEEAQTYLEDLQDGTRLGVGVEDPYLAGLLAAKAAAASESGVGLSVGEPTWVPARLRSPLDAVTVVANLVDNAVRAAADGPRRPAWVEVTLVADGADLVVHVVDSGAGVSPAEAGRVFDNGFTTREDASGRHGIGLALARQTARRHGGEVELVATGGDAPDGERTGGDGQDRDGRGGSGHGAVFRARMCDVLLREDQPTARAEGTGR